MAYVNAGTRVSSAGATSAVPALPASLVTGNILLAICGTKNNATHTTATSGWNKIDQRNSGTGWTVSLFWRKVDGTQTAPTITWTGSVANFAIQYQFNGTDPNNPIGAFLGNNGTTSPHTNAGITGTRANSQVIYIGGAAANTAYGATTGWTEREDTGSNTGATRQVVGERNTRINSGDASGSTSSTGAAAAWVMYQVELLSPLYSVTSNLNGLLGTASGNATTTVPQYSVSGSVNGLLGQVSSDATFVDGGRNITADISGLLGTASGNVETTVPQYSVSGSINGLLGTASGNIETTTVQYVITGSVQGLLGEVSANAQVTEPQYSISANLQGLLGSISANATTTVPQYSVGGNIVGLLGVVNGEAQTTVPQYAVDGNITGLLGGVDGYISTATDIYEISGNIIGILGEISASLHNEYVIETPPTEEGSGGKLSKRAKHLQRLQAEDEEIIYAIKIFLNNGKRLF